MARARNIKPSIFKNEVLGVADPLLTILFESLWCLADREGRLEDRPLRIKAETFPYRENLDVNRYLTELAGMGFIERYIESNQAIIQVVNFKKHQTPHNTERKSELPARRVKLLIQKDNGSLTVNSPLSDDGSTAALPPDSLIPDSLNLIPDTGIHKADDDSTAAASSVPSNFDEAGFAEPRQAPLPMREQPPVSDDPAVQMTVMLRRLGVNVMSTNPHLLQWVADGATQTLMAEAVSVAREQKPAPEKIAPGYLVPIVEKLLRPPVAAARPPARAAPVNEKFIFSHLDRSSDQAAMQATIKRHNIKPPEGDEEIEI